MRYPLQDMVFVREHRQDKASKALNAARSVVLEAEKQLAERKRELADYTKFRATEEERLIQSIMRKPVKLGDLTDIRLDISTMRERELDYVDQVCKAEGELDRAKEEVVKAQQAYKRATQDTEKLIEHKISWQFEQNLEIERLADLELEDFIGPKLDRDHEPQLENHRYELN